MRISAAWTSGGVRLRVASSHSLDIRFTIWLLNEPFAGISLKMQKNRGDSSAGVADSSPGDPYFSAGLRWAVGGIALAQ